ncbi:DUF3515 family protein [Streptomyces boncukensis]|uniref:DUF3515 domain-containing protein n=1 Tax=Streptomyces boncukensis TaxID=2711219 RepID=A0A6G4WPG5_9ACTN|nr:DUF3515 domain-containing protein [Streptomyces boncukensis]
MSTSRRASRHIVPTVPLALLLALAAACSSSDGSAGPAVPHPSGKAAQACRALHGALPKQVAGQRRASLDPESRYTAAWGDPPVELRCGVARPEKLTPGSEEYNPTADAAEVNGVSWLIEKRKGGYRFTTTDRAAYVELTVPEAYAPETGALTDLAGPVRKTVPRSGPR